MKTKRIILISILFLFGIHIVFSQALNRNIKSAEYNQLQNNVCTGWNTWYNHSVMSHVLLPESFSINLCLSKSGSWGSGFTRDIIKTSKKANRDEEVSLGLRSDDGEYTSLRIKYKGDEIEVQSARNGEDQLILVTPHTDCQIQLIVEAGVLWNKQGTAGMENNTLFGKFPEREITVHTTGEIIEDAYAPTTAPHITISLDNEVGIYTGRKRTLAEIKSVIAAKRAVEKKRIAAYGDLAEQFKAMQTILSWNTIYDAPNHRAITPVSRNWNRIWGGFVMFDWDTYFAGYMLALFNKDLAYANVIEITKAITPDGFIPNYQAAFDNVSWDRSQPPIGSTVILEIFKRYGDKWFLEEVYDELLRWNRWWANNRDVDGYLAWGSNMVPDSLKSIEKNNLKAAMYESGLDNSPMYDDVPFDKERNVMLLADVGLMSFYIMDCNSMVEIATILGKNDEAKKIKKRAEKYKKTLATLWDEETGIFLNKRLDTGEKSYRLTPTNFYPMLTKACTQKQAETMMAKHYFNPDEFYGEFVMPSVARNDPAFKDNTYWRGRIWAPMNFLVYMGMCNYDVPEAKADLIKRSNALLMKSWNEDGSIYENYNGTTGVGNDVGDSDGFYHWGALLIYMSFIEQGFMDSNQK
jgi:putative isomerase